MEYLVVTPSGHDFARDDSYQACVAAARRLGLGARVMELDEMLCKTGVTLFEAETNQEQD